MRPSILHGRAIYQRAEQRMRLTTELKAIGLTVINSIGVASILSLNTFPANAQQTQHRAEAPVISQSTTTDWPLHNLDVRNTRFAPIDSVNTSNVNTLELKWSYQSPPRELIRSTTPLVIDGIMYFNSGSQLVALDASTGNTVWTFQADPAFPGGGRGPSYGDGKIYAFGPTVMYAVDAKTGELVESFGSNGLLEVAREALTFKYPDTYPPTVDTTSMGFAMTNPPTVLDGTLFVGLPFSEGLLPGGLLAAVDGTTGAMKWVSNTIPQRPQDEGWEIAKDTWSNQKRYGGGIWLPPAVDTELGMVYFNAANPSPNYDGSSRTGMNLFTNSMLAVDIDTGELKWFYQTLHHDIWDWDLAAGPVLFDKTHEGQRIRGVASLGKTCYVYILDRETGKPLNPIVETTVPVDTDVPNEEVWPTQPIPHTSKGVAQDPFCATYPIVDDPELAPRVRQSFHPYQVNEFVITSPGNTGGANYGSPSFSPQTGLLYVTGKNDAWSIKVKVVGDTMEPGPGFIGHFGNIEESGDTGLTPTSTLAAYEPISGEQVWYAESAGITNGGNLVTSGDVVFQGLGSGHFHGFDANSGERLFTYAGERPIHASPLTYQVNGTQYVAITATNEILVFALP